MKRSQRWKALEKRTAKRLEGERVLRGSDFSKSDVDVVLALHPELKVDAKAYKRFAHHSLVREIRKRYCKDDCHIPVLVTAEPRQRDPYVTVPLSFFAQLLRDRATVLQWLSVDGAPPANAPDVPGTESNGTVGQSPAPVSNDSPV